MAKAKWTEEEMQILKEKYGTISNKELAKIMGRSKQAIQHLAHRLNITTLKVANYKHCVDCGTLLSRAAIYKKNAERCVSCANKKRSKEGHHNWKGGVAPLRSLVHILLKPAWIIPIMQRDNFTCQFCGKRGGDMNVHHILPYRKIRDKVIKDNPEINQRTFEGKKILSLKIVDAHNLSYGITLCIPCHKYIHSETGGELLGTPNVLVADMDNQQPSRANVLNFVARKVHRLIGEDAQSNKPDTSAAHSISLSEDIVGTCR